MAPPSAWPASSEGAREAIGERTATAMQHKAGQASIVLHEKPMSPAQAADHLGVSRATVYRLCARSEIPHLRVGSSLRLLLADVIASLARRGS